MCFINVMGILIGFLWFFFFFIVLLGLVGDFVLSWVFCVFFFLCVVYLISILRVYDCFVVGIF